MKRFLFVACVVVALLVGLVASAEAQQCNVGTAASSSASSQQALLNLQNQILAAQLSQGLGAPAPAATSASSAAGASSASSAASSAPTLAPAQVVAAPLTFAPVPVAVAQVPQVALVQPVAVAAVPACNSCNSRGGGLLSGLRGRSRSVSISRSVARN